MKNVLNFYLAANQLKNVIRTGWKEVEISKERLESVAEHIYGCLILAIATVGELNLDLDLLKVIKMIVVKELEKVTLKEITTRDYPSNEDRIKAAKETLIKLTSDLTNRQELLDLQKEINERTTKEAVFAYQLAKIESDIQAKMYDLDGSFDLNKALEDAKYYGEPLSSEIIPQMNNASDGWILFDRRYYTSEYFKELSKLIQDLK